MKFKLDAHYSEKELEFLEKHNCKILSEIKLSKTNFSEYEVPRRMGSLIRMERCLSDRKSTRLNSSH